MVLTRVTFFASRRPLIFQSIVSGCIAASGDAMSQLVIEGTTLDRYDVVRTSRFAFLGTFLVAPVLFHWFRTLDRLRFGPPVLHPVQRVLVDQLLFGPVFSTCWLTSLRILEGRSWEDNFKLLQRDWWPLWKTGLCFWPIVQLLNFTFVPLNNRVITTNAAGLIWNCYISFKTQKAVI
ncbi:unnamed protein product, partial [Mesorhabditis spiculigera]